MSWGDTLADDPEALERYTLHPDLEDPPPAVPVEAPCCGKERAADAIADVRGVPEIDRDWLCSGCRTAMERAPSTDWTPSRMRRAMGAPAAIVRKFRVRELVEERRRQAASRDETFRSREALEAVRARVSDTDMPDGTEPPG